MAAGRARSFREPVAATALAALGTAAYGAILLLGHRHGWVYDLGNGDGTSAPSDLRMELPWLTVLYVSVLVGAVLAARLRRHPIPWLLGALGIGHLGFPALTVTVAQLEAAGAAEGLVVAVAWIANWIWLVGSISGTYLLLLFPDGRPLSPRWGRLARGSAVYFAALFVLVAAWPHLEAAPGHRNPLAIDALAGREALIGPALVGLFVVQILAITNLVVRFVRSRGVERLQMKWMAWAGASLLVLLLLQLVVDLPRWLQTIPTALVLLALVVAVTHYRLYAIDRIIRRTISYGTVTVVLAGTYALAIVALGAVARAVTGGGTDLAVVGSTLVVAALFRPVHQRVQRVVDRRFNRARYDVVRAAEAFAQRLRDEVDLGTIERDLQDTVSTALQPAQLRLWLR